MRDCKYKISIIIPMYNATLYIGNCLDSIFSSGLPDDAYEVVVVNDGSTDSGPEKVAEFMKSHVNLSYYTQENQGQSTARNLGIKVAKGEYIWCVDADDEVNVQTAEVLEKLIQHPSLDILAVQLRNVREDGAFINMTCTQPTVLKDKIIQGRDAVLSGYNPSSVCALLIRKSLLIERQLYFVYGITHQDVELTYRLMCNARDVMFVTLAPYIYIQHPNSTSNDLNPQKKIKYLLDDIYIIQSFTKLANSVLEDKPLSEVIKRRVSNIHFGMVHNLYINRRTWKPMGISKAVILDMRRAGLYPLRMEFDSWGKNLFTLILNCENWLS